MIGHHRTSARRDDDPRAARVERKPQSSPARLDQIRERIRENAYDSDEVLEAVAYGILRSGDL